MVPHPVSPAVLSPRPLVNAQGLPSDAATTAPGALGFLASPYARTGCTLAGALVFGPLWTSRPVTLPVVSPTIGRVLIVAVATMLLLDLVRARPAFPAAPRAAKLFGGSLVLLGVWIAVSAAGWGCGCVAGLAGYVEVAAIGILALAVCVLEPRFRLVLIVAAATGAAVAAGLAATGLGPIWREGAPASTNDGRLAGTYGNPNELGYAVAFAIPVLVALILRGSWRLRALLTGPLVVVAGVLLVTFSRSALLAAAAGSVAVVALNSRGRRDALTRVAVVAVVLGVVSTLLYPTYQEARASASFGPPRFLPDAFTPPPRTETAPEPTGEPEPIGEPRRNAGPEPTSEPPPAIDPERLYVRSRLDGAELAVDSFVSNPIAGIGWDDFQLEADAKLPYGRLATHNDYLRVAAELGLPGLALLGALGVALIMGVRASDDALLRASAGGVLATGALNLAFINAIVLSTATLPLVVAGAVVCATCARGPTRDHHVVSEG